MELYEDNLTKEILAALDVERTLTYKLFAFVVEHVEELPNGVRVTVDPADLRSRLDESLEGQTAWWVSPANGYASVLSVIADYSKMDLRFASAPLPPPGTQIFIVQPDFLGALMNLWENQQLSEGAIKGSDPESLCRQDGNAPGSGSGLFPDLRSRQRECFRLPNFRGSFLWGPPGTGKTTTLGCLAAAHMLNHPESRILLVSTTNTAADQAIVAVDRALEDLSTTVPKATQLRKLCRRIGLHFLPDHFVGREHLLPVHAPDLIRRLADLEARRPDPAEDSVTYEEWRDNIDALRAEIREQLLIDIKSTRLHAMTSTHATFDFGLLDRLHYDLVIFDEASQVSLAHGLMLSALGRHSLFAGDPRQLAPIVQSELPVAEKWLGHSMFDLKLDDRPNTVMLDEQNRMCEPICNIVSSMFYAKQLKVAVKSRKDPQWLVDRQLPDIPGLGANAVVSLVVHQEGTPDHPGWYRLNSIEQIARAARELAKTLPEEEILTVTPFRAQRYRIARRLREIILGRIAIPTIHRSQGSEYHTVIVDPVRDPCTWLMSDEGMRLINVAISRAKARLIVTLSTGDRTNPSLDLIGYYAEAQCGSGGSRGSSGLQW